MSKGIMFPPFLADRLGLPRDVVNEAWLACGYKLGEITLEQSKSVVKELARRGLTEPPQEAPVIKPKGQGRAITGKYASYGSKISRTLSIPIRIYIYMEEHSEGGNVSAYINDLVIEKMGEEGK